MNRKPSNVAMGTPVAEFAVDEELVSRLLSAQHSDLAHLPLRAIDAGWDNTMFRLGEHLAVRLPRRSVAATLITHEQHWLQSLAKQLPLPVPAPCRVGKPALGYPWPWSIVPWLKGLTADQSEPGESQAVAFARFLCALHVPAPADAPLNYMRGVSLGQRAPSINARIRRLKERTHLITPGIEQVWNEALAGPIDVASTWLHGYLHPLWGGRRKCS